MKYIFALLLLITANAVNAARNTLPFPEAGVLLVADTDTAIRKQSVSLGAIFNFSGVQGR